MHPCLLACSLLLACLGSLAPTLHLVAIKTRTHLKENCSRELLEVKTPQAPLITLYIVAQSVQQTLITAQGLFLIFIQTCVNTRNVSCTFVLWYVTQFYLYPGSKNPDITLKIAEIRTDNLGKVSACSVSQNSLPDSSSERC